MIVIVPPGMIILAAVAWPAVMVIPIVITRIIRWIVVSGSGSHEKAKVHTCLSRLWSESRQPKNSESDNKVVFISLYFQRDQIVVPEIWTVRVGVIFPSLTTVRCGDAAS